MITEASRTRRSNDLAAFRSRLKTLMLRKSAELDEQLTQARVAKAAGVSLTTIQRLYDPDYTFNRIDADTLYGLRDYFGCSFDDLIERVPDEKAS